jgi:hypothetical protein
MSGRTTGLHPRGQFDEDVGGIAEQADGLGLAGLGPAIDHGQRLVERMGLLVDIAGAQAEIDAGLVAFDREAAGAGHDGRQRLGAAHAAKAAGQDPLALEVAAIVLAAGLGEGLVGALNDALRADIDPGARGHLAVHHQALLVELVEMVPVGPVRHQVGVGDQHARRIGMGAEHADRLARLHQQRLVIVERLERGDNRSKSFPGARGAANAAIDHQLVRVFGHVRVQIVHQHAHRRFGEPALRGDLGAGRRIDVALVVSGLVMIGLPMMLQGQQLNSELS